MSGSETESRRCVFGGVCDIVHATKSYVGSRRSLFGDSGFQLSRRARTKGTAACDGAPVRFDRPFSDIAGQVINTVGCRTIGSRARPVRSPRAFAARIE